MPGPGSAFRSDSGLSTEVCTPTILSMVQDYIVMTCTEASRCQQAEGRVVGSKYFHWVGESNCCPNRVHFEHDKVFERCGWILDCLRSEDIPSEDHRCIVLLMIQKSSVKNTVDMPTFSAAGLNIDSSSNSILHFVTRSFSSLPPKQLMEMWLGI